MYGGGKIHVDGGFAAHPGVLFRYENDTPANFGPNTSMIRVDHLQLDAGVNRNYQFLTMESNANLGYHLDAVFRDIALPSDGFAWEVGIDTSGKAHVTLENITYLPTNFLTWHHGLVATGARVNYHIQDQLIKKSLPSLSCSRLSEHLENALSMQRTTSTSGLVTSCLTSTASLFLHNSITL
jgi:hypothetical protein